jgi:hypothetical protein
MTARTRQCGQDSRERTAWRGQPGQVRDMTDGIGQDGQNITAITGQWGEDSRE